MSRLTYAILAFGSALLVACEPEVQPRAPLNPGQMITIDAPGVRNLGGADLIGTTVYRTGTSTVDDKVTVVSTLQCFEKVCQIQVGSIPTPQNLSITQSAAKYSMYRGQTIEVTQVGYTGETVRDAAISFGD